MRFGWICAVLVVASPTWASKPGHARAQAERSAEDDPSFQEGGPYVEPKMPRAVQAETNPVKLKAQAEHDIQEGNYEAAIPKLRRAIELAPDDPIPHKYLGGCLINMGESDRATDEYHAFLRLAPNHPEADRIRQMLRAYERARGENAADEPAPQPATRHPAPAAPASGGPVKDALGLRTEAEAQLHKGNYDGAATLLRKAIAANPRDALAHKELGACLIDSGDSDGAVVEYRKFIELAPNHPEARRIRQMLEAYEKARRE